MAIIFSYFIENIMKLFMDDFYVYSTNFDDCLLNISKVLHRCEKESLVLSWEKCYFMVLYLGTLSLEEELRWIKPKLNFYLRFIRDLSKISKPLSNLLLKEALIVMCDASNYATRNVLAPRKDKKVHAIYYANKTLDEKWVNSVTIEKEFLTIVYVFEKFKSYLMGSKVIIYIDHSNLKRLVSKKDAKAP
ncbi:Retrovirus-related Pol polyprotein from transposon 17.6, partial [Mucuna pruriens]